MPQERRSYSKSFKAHSNNFECAGEESSPVYAEDIVEVSRL